MKAIRYYLGRLLSTLILSTATLFVGCEDMGFGLQEPGEGVDILDGITITTLNGQIVAINASVSALKAVDAELRAYIKSLETAAEELNIRIGAEVAALNQMDDSLIRKIASLEAYVKEGLLTKDWAEATFATLAQYDLIQTELAYLKEDISQQTWDFAALDSLQSARINTAVASLSEAILTSESGMKHWVNEHLLSKYYDIAAIDAKFANLSDTLASADMNLQKQIEIQKEELTAAKAELTSAYQAAITEAIANANGVVNEVVAMALAQAQEALEVKLEEINMAFANIYERLGQLEADFVSRIQSFKYIPEYTDKIAPMSGMSRTVSVDFILTPYAQASVLEAMWKKDSKTVNAYIKYAKFPDTRALVDVTPLMILSMASDNEGFMNMVLGEDPKFPLSDEFLSGNANGFVYVHISDGKNDVVSDLIETRVSSFEVGVSFSTDGEIWHYDIPETFESLFVRTVDDTLTESHLDSIKMAIKNQGSVDLDLSGAVFESHIFPSVFSGSEKLKSIKFPSNVTAISESAFANCVDLQSVDLTGIKKIERQAFRYSGLKTLNVPSSVDSIGNEAFAYLQSVESVYYNATPSGHYTKGATGYKILCNRSTEWTNNAWNNRDNGITITIGPDVKEIPPYFFDTNARLTNLVIEAGKDLKFWDQWAIRAFNIERIEFKGDAPTCEALGQGGSFAAQLNDKEGVVVCPKGKYDEFSASPVVNSILATGKYRLRELGDEDVFDTPGTIVEYSTDGRNWSTALPSSFTDLYVKTDSGALTSDDLTAIKLAVDAQNGPVYLDLSQAEYESTEFPAVFRATADAPDTKLKSVRFPSNTVGIANYAFEHYKALETVDLTRIESIGIRVFQYTGLKNLTIPSSVKSIGNLAFAYCAELEIVYYNPTIDYSQCADSDLTNNLRFLSNRDIAWGNKDWNNRDNPTKVTFGPNATVVTGYFFDSNAKVTEIIVEGDNLQFVYQWGIRARNIERFEFKRALPTWHPVHSSHVNGADFASELVENEGVVVVPDELLADALTNEFIQNLIQTGKYRLRAKSNEFEGNDPVLPSATLEYSTDGQSYSSSMPSSFSDLWVRSSDVMRANQLTAIKTAIDAQSSPVALDLSGIKYESTTFPATFAGTTDAPGSKLKSIIFPSNVTVISESAFAYCADLQNVDLEGIKKIERLAFKYSGLKTLNVSSSVDSIGNEAFAYLQKVESVYYNATPSGQYTKGATGYKILCNRSTTWSNKDWNNRDNGITITIGPDVKEIPPYFFDTNARLTNLVIYAGNDIKFWDQWAIRAYNIERIEFKGNAPDCEALGQGGNFAAQLNDKEGVVVCPVGKYDDFATNAFIQSILATGKYRLRELGSEDVIEDPQTIKEYSSDGQNWSTTLPSSFTNLYVKTDDSALTSDDLTAIKAAVDAQNGPVYLDLSQAEYESTEFPAVFRGTADAPDTRLKSVKFPSNIIAIEDNSFEYFKALETVDLTRIESIGARAFQRSGLKNLLIPSSVKYIGSYAFAYCPDLASLYYNPDSDWSLYSNGYKDGRHLSNRDTEWKNKDWNNREHPLSVTIGPDVKVMPGYCFDTNAKLTELIVEASNVLFYWQWEIRCYNIERIEFKAGLPDPASGALTTAFAQNLVAEEGVIVVPDGKYEEALGNEFIKKLMDTGKYRLRTKSEEGD